MAGPVSGPCQVAAVALGRRKPIHRFFHGLESLFRTRIVEHAEVRPDL
jgi:hypothetical protein